MTLITILKNLLNFCDAKICRHKVGGINGGKQDVYISIGEGGGLKGSISKLDFVPSPTKMGLVAISEFLAIKGVGGWVQIIFQLFIVY